MTQKNKKKTIRITTLGCSKNTVDTEHLLAQLNEDYEVLPEYESGYADYVLLNTCGFIADAKLQSIDAVLEAAEFKKQGKIGKVIVFGCLSDRYMDEMPTLIPEVDAWFDAKDILQLA